MRDPLTVYAAAFAVLINMPSRRGLGYRAARRSARARTLAELEMFGPGDEFSDAPFDVVEGGQ